MRKVYLITMLVVLSSFVLAGLKPGQELVTYDTQYEITEVNKTEVVVKPGLVCSPKTVTTNVTKESLVKETKTVFDNTTNKDVTITSYIKLVEITFYNTIVCEEKDYKAVTTSKGNIALDSSKYTFSVKDDVVTVKDLARGGSWKDHDLDSCYNPGVPCVQYSYSSGQPVKIKEIGDINYNIGVKL